MKYNIIVDNDKCWGLNIVKNTINYFENKNLKIDKIWVLPSKISHKNDSSSSIWYLKTFGFYVFIKLGIFYLLSIFKNYYSGFYDFKSFSSKYHIDVIYIKSLNDKNLLNYLNKRSKIISFAVTNHIFNKKIINLRDHTIINKHSSLLPSFKGLFPYFWTKIMNKPNGVTFHIIDEKIDNGKIIYQKKINKNFNSMISFYLYVFNIYPKYLYISLKNLNKKKYKKKKYSSSYYSLPTKNNYKKFVKKKGSVISISDLFKVHKLSYFSK